MRVLDLGADFAPDDPAPVRRLQFRPDGRRVAATVGERGRAGAVVFWDVAEERAAAVEWTGAGGSLARFADPAVSVDHRWMAYHAHDEETDTEGVTLTPVGRSRGEGSVGDPERFRVRCVAFTPDARTLLVGVRRVGGHEVACWDVERLAGGGVQAMNVAEEEPFGFPEAPCALAPSPDGGRLVVGLAGTVLAIPFGPDAAGGAKQFPLRPATDEPPRELLFDAGGRTLAARFGKRVVVWDAATRRPRGDVEWPATVGGVAFTPDGRALAVAGRDGVLALFDAETLEERGRYRWGLGPLYGVAFAPDGMTGWLGLGRGRVAVWDRDG